MEMALDCREHILAVLPVNAGHSELAQLGELLESSFGHGLPTGSRDVEC